MNVLMQRINHFFSYRAWVVGKLMRVSQSEISIQAEVAPGP